MDDRFTIPRRQFFGGVNPTDSIMIGGSYRHSETDDSGRGLGEYGAASTSWGLDATMRITVLEGTWVVNDNSFLSVEVLRVRGQEHLLDQTSSSVSRSPLDGSVRLDVDNLDQQGEF